MLLLQLMPPGTRRVGRHTATGRIVNLTSQPHHLIDMVEIAEDI
jgi:hypothetical protein